MYIWTMDHVAIMNKKWDLIEKIVREEKTVESRWYKTRKTPWNRIKTGDIVYFKNSGEPIIAKAKVADVKQYILPPYHSTRVSQQRAAEEKHRTIKLYHSAPNKIYIRYGKQIGMIREEFEKEIINKGLKYCVLIWLDDPQRISPFNINKRGFGTGAAWITVDNVKNIKA